MCALTVVSGDCPSKTDIMPFRFGEEDILRCIIEKRDGLLFDIVKELDFYDLRAACATVKSWTRVEA